jgi:acyl dehydratase
MRTLTLDELPAHLGEELAIGEWITIDQGRIDRFADATGDHQWIHVDPARAAEGPYGRTVAHGFLTLSLIPTLFQGALAIPAKLSINYGLDRVRFPNPVLVDSRVRGRFKLLEAKPLPPIGDMAGLQLKMEATLECDGADKPACVAEVLTRRYG